jgi:sirohydrochlorin ferrochelatase
LQLPSAYLLVFHGSRDRRPQAAVEKLSEYFSCRIQHIQLAPSGSAKASEVDPDDWEGNRRLARSNYPDSLAASIESQPIVAIAALECSSESLHAPIVRLGNTLQTIARNPTKSEPITIQILPLFLLQGVHVMEDIPQEVALAQQALGTRVRLGITSHLGSRLRLQRLIPERMAAFPAEAWILLAHGSRRPGANQAVEALAERLGAISAYWSVPPDLESRLLELVNSGTKRVAIFPYFLFSGSVTDAIAQLVARLAAQFPTLDLYLIPPLDATPELADLLVDLVEEKVKNNTLTRSPNL